MMVAPLSVYEELKNKSVKEIEKAVREFRRAIKRLKRIDSEQEYSGKVVCPSCSLQIEMNRAYLQYAILALQEQGVEYIPSKEEKKSLQFNEKLEDLRKIEFHEGGFLGVQETHVVEFDELGGARYVPDFLTSEEKARKISKSDVIEGLKDLYIGEWRRKYFAPVLDGTQWELTLYFYSDRKKTYYGSNAYPFSYEKLKEFFYDLAIESENCE